MKAPKPKKISDLLPSYLRLFCLDTPLAQARLLRAYTTIVGPVIAQHTTNLFIQDEKLHIHLSSPALRHRLLYQRTALLNRLNQAARQQIIKEIVIH